MPKNKEVDNSRLVRQLREGDTQGLVDLFTHYRDTAYGSGGFSLTWGREASELILTLLEERESFKERAQHGPKEGN